MRSTIESVAAKIKDYFDQQLPTNQRQIQNFLKSEFEDKELDLAYILIVSVIRTISDSEIVEATKLQQIIMKNLNDAITVEQMERGDSKAARFIEDRWKKHGVARVRAEKLKLAKYLKKVKDDTGKQLTTEKVRVGAVLIEILLAAEVKLIDLHLSRKGVKTTRVVSYTPECYNLVIKAREMMLGNFAQYPIFVVPPKPWTKYHGNAGYYTEGRFKADVIRQQFRKARNITYNKFRDGGYDHLFDVLNNLAATPWRVNKRVLEVMHTVFSQNIVDPKYPATSPKLIGGLPYNDKLDPYDAVNPADYGDFSACDKCKWRYTFEDPKKGREFRAAIEEQDRFIQASNSQALLLNLILGDAISYANEDEIYFSYNYDYRGRIYPMQQLLQPQGSSENKALLVFANGSPLDTPESIRWFKIHGANCFGLDKAPYDDRVEAMDAMHDDIVRIADDPMGTRDLWSDTDEPYLFLAWCFEYADWVKDPDNFESHLAIALDATCSGLQIYSGLMRDAEGAKAVNVIGDTREDVYQRVADKVNGYLKSGEYPKTMGFNQSDGELLEIDMKPIADSFKGNVKRSLVKRNVMTVPYSVTQQGMKDQLRDELTKMERGDGKFWIGENWKAAALLSILNARAIDEVVQSASIAQDYLKRATDNAAKHKDFIEFETPLTSFPFIQVKPRYKVKKVWTGLGRFSIQTPVAGELDKRAVKNSIAPNFIHSLDAALLQTVVNRMKAAGCDDFHMIHDSFGVPAKYIATMNTVIREAFVELFDAHPLRMFFMQNGAYCEQEPEEVMVNTLNLNDILSAAYIFS